MEYSKAVLLLGSKITKKNLIRIKGKDYEKVESAEFLERESKVNRSHSQIESMLFEKRKTNRYKSQINIE